MKKILLSTVAILAIGAAAVSAQAAADSKGVKLGLGGYFSAHGAFVSQDDGVGEPGVNTRNFDIVRHAEIDFKGEATFDNGLTTGAVISLMGEPQGGSSNDQIEDSYLYMSGNWGKFEIGSTKGTSYKMVVGAPAVDDGIDGIDPDFILANKGSNVTQEQFFAFAKTGELNAEKVAYYTPRFNGFQAGVSYAPDAQRQGLSGKGDATSGFTTNNTTNEQSERLEAGVNYQGNLAGVGLLVGGTYAQAESETTPSAAATNNQKAWTLGAQAEYMGFTVGGGYLTDDNASKIAASVDRETETWTAGVGYGMGPYKVGVSYFDTETDKTATTQDELQRWVVGGSYDVGPGVKLGSTLQFHDYDSATLGDKNDATVFTVGTTVNF